MKLFLLCLGSVAAGVTFTEVGESLGVASTGQSFAVTFVDIDGDGDQDMFVTNSGSSNILYINSDGRGTFTDATAAAGLTDNGASRGAAFADVNGDGLLDLYVADASAANHLYIGTAQGTFKDTTAEAGVADEGTGQGVCFADVDGDGDMDLFVVNFAQSNTLYLNNGEGIFENATAKAGLVSTGNAGFGCAFGDVDEDGDLDLYVTNSGQQCKLYLNNGKGVFSDETEKASVGGNTGQKRAVSMADLNGDGHLDIFYVGPMEQNQLFLGDGTGHFSDGTAAAGLDYKGTAQGMNIADVDGDGDLDIFISQIGALFVYPCQLYQNDGKGHFKDIASAAQVDYHLGGQGVAFGDVDGDGDLDMYVETWAFIGSAQKNKLLINQGSIQKWLAVRPLDEHGRPTLIGTEIRIFEAGSHTLAAARGQVDGGSGFASQNSYDVYFGLSGSNAAQFDIELRCQGSLLTKAENPELGGVSPNQVAKVKCLRTQVSTV